LAVTQLTMLLTNVARYVELIAPSKSVAVPPPPMQINTFFPALCAAVLTAEAFEAIRPPDVSVSPPVVVGVSEKKTRCVIARMSRFEGVGLLSVHVG
jgi:hypothetical protein